MKSPFNGLGRVFSFTLRRQVGQKGYRGLTVTLALLCLLLPAVILWAAAYFGGGQTAASCAAQEIVVVDHTDGAPLELSYLNELRPEGWPAADYAAAGGSRSLLVTLDRDQGGAFRLTVRVPEDSQLTQADADAYAAFLDSCSETVLRVKAGLAPQATQTDDALSAAEAAEAAQESARSVLSMVLPYVCLLLLYFMVLFYGQSVAGCVLMEKTSKLMDFFLVTVKPAAMVLGKILATALAGVLQLAVWLLSLTGGFALGVRLANAAAPGRKLAVVELLESLSLFTGMFSLPSVLVAVGIILAGFLMYCSLAAIGGSLASKSEDLGTTNILFSTVLVASFLCCMFAGGMSGMTSDAAWLSWVPFTAVLIAPARVVLGELSVRQGLLSLGLVVLFALAVAWLAGRVYRMMSLYKGNPPTIQKAFEMLRAGK